MKISIIIFHIQEFYKFFNNVLNWKIWLFSLITIIIKIICLILFCKIIELTLKKSVRFVIKNILGGINCIYILYKNRVFDSIIIFFTLFIGFVLFKIFFYNYNVNFIFFEKIFNILLVVILFKFLTRVINSIMKITINAIKDDHKTIAVHSFFQLLKVISIIFCILIVIAILTKYDLFTILTSLGAITAVVILVFKDIILGFVSGIQMASNKMIKVGDWIGIPKYKIEGTVIEINLVSSKLENFDKTVTHLPTYDLISNAIVNFEQMRKKNLRRIKKSILFNIQSFSFCEKKELKKFKTFFLIKHYIEKKQKKNELNKFIKDKKFTNIELFRQYALEYLINHSQISKSETLMVRYLDIKPYGLPIELYCFTKTSESSIYENIKSNILDHLLTISKEFNLEITYTTTYTKLL